MYFFDVNRAFRERTLFIDDQNQHVTYGDWYHHASALKSIIKPRSLVAILCHNRIGSALSYLCCLQDRIVPILIDSQMDTVLMKKLLALYQPEYIFQPSDLPASTLPVYSFSGYNVYKAGNIHHDIYPDLGLLLTTSGSTGSPKLVRQSYDNIHSNATAIAEYLHLSETERPVSTLPMHYTFGLSVINSHVLCGATECLTDKTVFEPAFWDFCKEKEVTSLAGVPFTYECLNRLGFMKMDLPHLELMIQAGGKLSKRLQKKFAEFATETGKTFVVMYGQTEATARMSYLPFDDCLRKIGSIGIPIPGGTFHIMEDESHETTEPNKVGELCYEGPNVTLGYAHGPEDLALGDERHGRLMTGDMAYVDEEGFYYIAGRKKRFLKIMGKRTNMDEIESLFREAFPNYDFACTGYDDNLWIFTTAKEEAFEELERFIYEKTGLHPACFSFHTIDAIPVNSSGKIKYPALKEMVTMK